MIKVKYFGQLRTLTAKDTEEMELPAEGSVTGLVNFLSKKYGSVFSAITLMVLVDGKMVDKTAPLLLSDGREVTLLTPIAGG